jgi:hypothetical protein
MGQSCGGGTEASVLAYVLIGMVCGVITEGCARLLNLWVYRQPQTAVLNIIVVFGGMGAMGTLVPRYGMLPAFAAGGAVGLLYEVANLAFLDWWEFPDRRIGFVRGHAAIVVLMSVGWGMVPLVSARAHAELPHLTPVQAPRQSALERLNEREKVLIGKLDAVRQREHDIESRLADVRRRKQRVLDTHALRAVGRPTAPGAPGTP